MKKLFLSATLFLLLLSPKVHSQSLSVNTDGSNADASAMLDVKSTVKGVLIPRMSSAQRTAIASPATGLQVYDTDLNLIYFYNGATWTGLSASTNFWTLSAGHIYNNTGTNVGIGSTTPGDKLEVNGNIRLTGTRTILASPSTTGSANSVTLRAGDPYVPVGGAGGTVNIQATNNMPSGGSGYGNLGPSGDVNITSGTGYNTAGGNVNIAAGQSSYWGTVNGAHSDVIIKGGFNITSTDAGTITAEGGNIISFNSTTSNGGNVIVKSGLGAGGGTNGNIQLLNGNVGIGTAAPTSKLEVCGNTRIIGTLNVSATVTTSSGITCPSDIRYKRDITALEHPLEKLMQLNGVNYYWKTKEFSNMNFTDRIQVGFIAQDVEKLFPEMVFTDDAGYKSIDYSRLTPVLVETVKEQQKQINDIAARLKEMEKLLIK